MNMGEFIFTGLTLQTRKFVFTGLANNYGLITRSRTKAVLMISINKHRCNYRIYMYINLREWLQLTPQGSPQSKYRALARCTTTVCVASNYIISYTRVTDEKLLAEHKEVYF